MGFGSCVYSNIMYFFSRITHVIPLNCSIPVDFEFTLSHVQTHPAFLVDPMSGNMTVPLN